MTKWEYLVETLRTPNDGTHLNERGSEGWELIDIRVTGQACVWLTFKRPLVEDVKYPWHDFTDGIIPALDAQVEVKRRNGTTDTGEVRSFRWDERGNEFDIMSWRLNG